MTTIDHARLRELAEKATPGPWELIGGDEYVTGVGIMVAPDDGGVSSEDAEFISATDPQTVLALLDELDVLNDQIEVMGMRRWK